MKILLLTFSLLISYQSCKKSIDTPTNDFENSVRTMDLSEGVRNQSFKLDDGSLWHYRISVPQLATDEKVPLVIALHWAGSSETYQEYFDCLAQPGYSNLKSILIAPSASRNLWWQLPLAEQVVRLVKLVKQHLPQVDSEKIVVTGYSNGGTGSWLLLKENPGVFTAAIPMAGSYSGVQKVDMPLYFIHGRQDELFAFENSKNFVADLKKKGTNVQLIESPRSHYQACGYVEELKEAVRELNW